MGTETENNMIYCRNVIMSTAEEICGKTVIGGQDNNVDDCTTLIKSEIWKLKLGKTAGFGH